MLLLWAGVIVIFRFFSLSRSKRISYVLPLAPAVARRIGRGAAKLTRETLRRHLPSPAGCSWPRSPGDRLALEACGPRCPRAQPAIRRRRGEPAL